METVDTELSNHSTKSPFLEMTNRLMTNLHFMHENLQTLLLEKLDQDGRNVIAAEIAREARDDPLVREYESWRMRQDLSDLELLNEYRKRYAAILGELEVARERWLSNGESKKRKGLNSLEIREDSSSELSSDSLKDEGEKAC
jgi:hypothetical protein